VNAPLQANVTTEKVFYGKKEINAFKMLRQEFCQDIATFGDNILTRLPSKPTRLFSFFNNLNQKFPLHCSHSPLLFFQPCR